MPEPIPAAVVPAAAVPPAAPAPAATPAAPATPPAAAPVAPAAAPAAPATPAAPTTLLGKDPATPAAPAPVAETLEQKAAKEAVVAEEKRLMEADEKTLSAEDLVKKQAIVKAKEEAAAAGKTVPEKYTVKAPEGMTVNQDILDKLTPILKEQSITQEGFQKIVDVYAPYIQEQTKTAILQQQSEAIAGFKETVKGWGEETSKELGPEPDKTLAPAARAINKLSTDPKGLRALMEETGVGNHKLFVQFMIAAGKLLGEDTFVEPGKETAAPGGVDPKVMFPTSPA